MAKNRNAEAIRQALHAHLPELERRYHVSALGLFGSYLREDQTEESDLDILVLFAETPSLLTFIELENYLTDLLNIKVDLVIRDALKPKIGEVSKNIPEEVRSSHPDLPWREMAGIRNKLIHDYFGVNLAAV